MPLSAEEEKTKQNAIKFAKSNKKNIAKELTDTAIFIPESNPVSVFMAGSPGAGKTEASKSLIESLLGDHSMLLRIDPDELRDRFEDYSGDNSWLFQGAISLLVEKIHDLALKQKQSFLLDGTLSRYDIAEKNIERSLKKRRVVQILYVYQEPRLAWEFVKARELEEGRRIEPRHFIGQYFAAREVVNKLKTKFGADVKVDLLLKNNDHSRRSYKAGIDLIDNHVPEKYTYADIEAIINAV